jgi:hypothetical protein
MAGRRARKRRSRSEWESIQCRFEESGLSQVEFCRREGLSLRNFNRWRQRLRGQPDPSPFVELCAPSEGESEQTRWELEILLPGGARLHFRG